MLRDRLPTSSHTTDTIAWGFQGIGRDALLEFTDPQVDRVVRQSGSRDDGGDATPSDLHGFGSRPGPPHPFVHERKKQVELASEAIYYSSVRHSGSRTHKMKSVKLLLPDS